MEKGVGCRIFKILRVIIGKRDVYNIGVKFSF